MQVAHLLMTQDFGMARILENQKAVINLFAGAQSKLKGNVLALAINPTIVR